MARLPIILLAAGLLIVTYATAFGLPPWPQVAQFFGGQAVL